MVTTAGDVGMFGEDEWKNNIAQTAREPDRHECDGEDSGNRSGPQRDIKRNQIEHRRQRAHQNMGEVPHFGETLHPS